MINQRNCQTIRNGFSGSFQYFLALTLSVLLAGTEVSGSEVESYFSSSYFDARKKFLDEAKNSGAIINHWKNPQSGPEGQAIFTDVAYIGEPNANNYVVVISGTHGVEGFAGSAIQTDLLRHGVDGDLPPSTAILFIHALNPYGFSHLRRFNEDNVDLNRNFVDDDTRELLINPGYSNLASAISPPDYGLITRLKSAVRLLWYRARHGREGLKRAITQGQFTHPEGLFYGGKKAVWSNRVLNEIIQMYLAGATRVVVIDVHTGLGNFAAAEMITNEPPDSPVHKRAVHIWGEMVTSTYDGTSVSEHLKGTLKLAMPKMIPSAEVTALSLEFGTVSPQTVFLALREENCFFHNQSGEHQTSIEVKQKLLNAFYPQSIHWRRRVWQQGREIFSQALDWIARTDSQPDANNNTTKQ